MCTCLLASFCRPSVRPLLVGNKLGTQKEIICLTQLIGPAGQSIRLSRAASVFGELWRLEPLSIERRTMWRRELEWLLSVSDHIVEFVPSWQHYPDGSSTEVSNWQAL